MVQTTQHIHFDYDNKRYRVELDTDILTTYGIDPTVYGGKLLGTIYFNDSINQQHVTSVDPLIDLSAGSVVSSWYNLPTDSNGDIINGSWTGNFSLRLTKTGMDIDTIAAPSTINMNGYGELAEFLTSGDSVVISAGPNAGTKTVTSVTGDVSMDLIIEVSQTLTNESPTGATLSFDVTHAVGTLTHTYTGCSLVTLNPKATFDCDSTEFGTFTGYDDTNYGTQTLTSTTLRIIHPSWTIIPYSTSDSVTTQDSPISKTLTQLYTGEWYVKLTSSIEYAQSDGAVISYTLTKTASEQVSCAGTLCGMLACIQNLLKNVNADLVKTGASANLPNLLTVLTNYDLAKEYLKCGDMDKYRLALAEIQTAIDSSDCECSCCDETQLIRIENVDPETATAITELYALIQYRLFNGVPSVNEDSTLGVQVGAVWQDYNTGIEYRCTDNTVGAAVWEVYYDPTTPVVATLQDVCDNDNSLQNADGDTYIVFKNQSGDQIGSVQNLADEQVNFVSGSDPTVTSLTFYGAQIISTTAKNSDGSINKSHSVVPAGSTTTNVGFGYCMLTDNTIPTVNWDSDHGWQNQTIVRLQNGLEYRCDDNTVGAAVWTQINPYTYWITLTQSSTSAPVPRTIQDNITGSFAFARTSTGVYTMTGTGITMDANTMSLITGALNQVGGMIGWSLDSATQLTIKTYDKTGALADGLLTTTTIKLDFF